MNDLLKKEISLRAEAAYTMSTKAADIAMKFYGKAQKWNKADSSPVTEADIAIDKEIHAMLKENFSDDGVLSEETESEDSRFQKDFTWVIDPIDGTKEFIKLTNDFCVMIGICYKGSPVYGVINIPTTGEIFYGGPDFGAFLDQDGQTTKLNEQALSGDKVLISKSHRAEIVIPYLEARKLEGIPCGSSGVKACRLINKSAQHYIHGTFIQEWDTAAADALVKGAGGYFTDIYGNDIVYNKQVPNVEGIIATFSKNQLLDIKDFFQK